MFIKTITRLISDGYQISHTQYQISQAQYQISQARYQIHSIIPNEFALARAPAWCTDH
jgi:hypothetical protein